MINYPKFEPFEFRQARCWKSYTLNLTEEQKKWIIEQAEKYDIARADIVR